METYCPLDRWGKGLIAKAAQTHVRGEADCLQWLPTELCLGLRVLHLLSEAYGNTEKAVLGQFVNRVPLGGMTKMVGMESWISETDWLER